MPQSSGSQTSLSVLNVLVTGGTTGIGRATAKALAAAGAGVFIFGRHEKELRDALKDMEGLSGKVKGMTADQSKPEDVERVFQEYAEAFPKLDVLINNAGIGGEDLSDESDEGISSIVGTNVCGYLFCARRAVRIMKKQRSGHIINVGSINAQEMDAGGEIYTGTKGANRAFSEALRKTVQKSGVKVSLIEPGSTGTDMSDAGPAEQRKAQRARKMIRAEDIADAICYCLSRPSQTVVALIQVLPLLDEEE